MAREAVLGGSAEQPEPEDRALRPQEMSEMIGQKDVIERLRIVVDAAQKRGEVLGHILFDLSLIHI